MSPRKTNVERATANPKIPTDTTETCARTIKSSHTSANDFPDDDGIKRCNGRGSNKVDDSIM